MLANMIGPGDGASLSLANDTERPESSTGFCLRLKSPVVLTDVLSVLGVHPRVRFVVILLPYLA